MTFKKVLLTHPGTQYVHQLAKQLNRLGILNRFYTGIAIAQKSLLHSLLMLLPENLYRSFSNRILNEIPVKKIINNFLLEILTLRKLKRVTDKESVFFERNKKFQEIIKDVWIEEADVVIGFDTSSWLLIDRVHSMNKKFILDVSIAHSKSKQLVFDSVKTIYPEWEFNIDNKKPELLSIEELELNNADTIVVASTFSYKSLINNGIASDKIFINPYGVNLKQFSPLKKYNTSNKPVKFLFVGLVDARKGIPLLLDAVKQIKSSDAHFTLVGPVSEQVKVLIDSYKFSNILLVGKVPHNEVAKYFADNDVFVFPSYFEGFALVILEAMASGLPVITTDATIGPDCIETGKQGFIMPSGNLNDLIRYIQFFIDNPSAIEVMGKHARLTAETFTWEAYGNRWASIIDKTMER